MTNGESFEERVEQLTEKYSAEAAVYEELWAPGLRVIARDLLDRVELREAGAVLDLGAGVGALLEDIADRAPRAIVVGTDRSEGMLRRAPGGFPRVISDATSLAFRDSSFDAVTMIFVLFHLPDPIDGLKEARRVLRAGGIVGTATWAQEEEWPARDVWAAHLDRCGADPPSQLLSQHELVDTPEKVEALLDRAGFTEITTRVRIFRRQWEMDGFVRFATGMALPKRRFDTLPEEVRPQFLEEAQRALGQLEPDDFVVTSAVVFATARA
ncbi:MAG: class I SAM-dependent methyltransferase [Actinomycetota bacterium]